MGKVEFGKEVKPEATIWDLESEQARVERLFRAEQRRRAEIAERLSREIKRLKAMRRH